MFFLQLVQLGCGSGLSGIFACLKVCYSLHCLETCLLKLFPYFKSILSEGENRKQICKSLGIDPTDDWNLLVLTCQHDTIGAITVKSIEDGTL